MNNIIKDIESEQIKKDIPLFYTGDTLELKIWVLEGAKKRLQSFEGVVISIKNRGLNSSFTLRKISYNNEGVERIFLLNSPVIQNINVKKRGDVRRSKLYHLRNRFGKSARIKEKLNKR